MRRRRFHTQQFLLNKITWPAFENSHRSWQEADRSTLLSEPHVELRHHASHYSSFLQQLYADPAAVGRALFSASKTDFGGAMADDVLRVLLLDLFGSAFQPHDERGVQQLFDAISEQQLAEHPPADMLQATGRTSLLTKLFVLYVRVYSADALTFLNTALREPLLAVLADDDLDLEIEPTMVWSRLPESAKADMFGEDHGTIPLDTTRLLGNPMFKAHLDQVYDRLLSFCTAIIASLTRALPVMPFTVRSGRWLSAGVGGSSMFPLPDSLSIPLLSASLAFFTDGSALLSRRKCGREGVRTTKFACCWAIWCCCALLGRPLPALHHMASSTTRPSALAPGRRGGGRGLGLRFEGRRGEWSSNVSFLSPCSVLCVSSADGTLGLSPVCFATSPVAATTPPPSHTCSPFTSGMRAAPACNLSSMVVLNNHFPSLPNEASMSSAGSTSGNFLSSLWTSACRWSRP